MSGLKYRMTPSERAGYAPGRWVVQYYDRDVRRWFDVGDPLTKGEAQARLKEREAASRETTTPIDDD